MKISFWIPAIVLCVVRLVFSNSVQVGTVLFTTTDLVRKCWTESDKSLLRARLIMQDVLPDPDCIDFSNPKAVVILLEYFHTCFQIISTSTYGKIQNLMYLALSDALGGYLRAYVLPFTRRAYYAGQLKYSEAKKLFQLYDDIKVFLKTNGMGWAEPQKLSLRKFRIMPLVITGGALEACKNLYTVEKEGKLHRINSNTDLQEGVSTGIELTKNSKDSFREENSEDLPKKARNLKYFQNSNSTLSTNQSSRNPVNEVIFKNKNDLTFLNFSNSSRGSREFFRNMVKLISKTTTQEVPQDEEKNEMRKTRSGKNACSKTSSSASSKRVIVPLPMLDDCEKPHSIAVPFKKRPLRNLKTRSSAFILEYYYVAVIKCFIAKGNTRTEIKNFNAQFHSWLVSQVFPHLNEEQWYPGFGGVLRVIETIKKFGVDNSAGDSVLNDIGYMFEGGIEFEVEGDFKRKGKDKARDVNDVEEEYPYSKRHLITAVLIVSLLWIFVFCACAFFFQATRGHSLLYEGNSESCSQRRSQSRDLDKNKSRFINFQFLVKDNGTSNLDVRKVDNVSSNDRAYEKLNSGTRFFKRKEEPEADTSTTSVFWSYIEPKQGTRQTEIFEGKQSKKRSKHTGTEQTPKDGQGDFFAFKIPKLERPFSPVLSAWPCQPCSVPFNKVELKRGHRPGAGDHQNQLQKQQDQVQMLWKKPSVVFKRNVVLKEGREEKSQSGTCDYTSSATTSEDVFGRTSSNSYSASAEDSRKAYSTEKPSSTCCCSESCQHSYTTSTYSSQTQVEEKLSSATMEFFEEVIARRKPRKKSSTQKSVEESESEEEGSSSSESDY